MLQSKDRLAKWIKKTKPIILLPIRDHFRAKDTHRMKVREWKKVFHANGNQKKAGVAILISNKINYEIKTVTRDKEGHNDQGINPKRYNNCKYICSQCRSTSIYKANTKSHKERN